MADIKRKIRFYQPNDPYYWEVDNLPLTDLLDNDLILEERLKTLEDSLSAGDSDGTLGGGGGGGGTAGGGDAILSGTISLGSITDLKGFSEPFTGNPGRHGKVFVNPGKFVARVQLPATRQNGSGMMRDHCTYFNNEDIYGAGGLDSTDSNTQDFVRESRGVARTALIEFLSTAGGAARGIDIPSFDDSDFNGGDPTLERLDLVYIRGEKPLDCQGDAATTPSDYVQNALPQARLGIIKGAYFRTVPVGGTNSNGPRFTDGVDRTSGRTIGMANADMPVDTLLPNFGTVPMPDDLVNFAWHRNYDTQTQDLSIQQLATKQIEYQAGFAIPVAYVRVPRSYREGDAIDPLNVIDIRPFIRSTELDYNERAAIAAAVAPNGHNYFITKFNLQNEYTIPLDTRLGIVESTLNGVQDAVLHNTSRIGINEGDIGNLDWAVSGTGATSEIVLGPHEARIRSLETSAAGGAGPLGISIDTEHTAWLPESTVFYRYGTAAQIGTQSNPTVHSLTSYVPASHRDKVVSVFLTFLASQEYEDFGSHTMWVKGDPHGWRVAVEQGSGANSMSHHGAGMANSMECPVTLTFDSSNNPLLSVSTYATSHHAELWRSMYIGGYKWKDTISF